MLPSRQPRSSPGSNPLTKKHPRMSAIPNKIRKAAILVTALDQAMADELLDQMSTEQAQMVRNAVLELGEVSAPETSQVIEEFLQKKQSSAGVEIDPSLADKLAEAPQLVDVDPGAPPEPTLPFRFLHETDAESLGDLLRWEHPQTIAVVLSHLPPSQGMEVLVHFPDSLQNQILQRMITLEQTNPDVVRNIEEELKRLFASKGNTPAMEATGLLAVQAIFKQADTHHRQQLLKNISPQDRQKLLGHPGSSDTRTDELVGKHRRKLATFLQEKEPELSPQMEALLAKAAHRQKTAGPPPVKIEDDSGDRTGAPHVATNTVKPTSAKGLTSQEIHFEQLASLGAAALATTLQAVEPRILLLALLGASPELMDRVTAPLTAHANKRLRNQMEQLGPLQLQDITIAQQLVAKKANQLLAEGSIQWPGKHRFAATA